MTMQRRHISLLGFLLCFALPAHGIIGDKSSRAMGLGQSYTALARGPEAVFWNPANLAIGGDTGLQWNLVGLGASLVTENNSFSVGDYNDNFTDDGHLITDKVKRGLLSDIPGDGLKLNVDVEPSGALLVPINGGVAFSLPGQMRSAVALGFTAGFEGEIPKDMVDLLLFGNEFNRQYDIAKWDGSGWAVGSLNWAVAKPLMPTALAPHLSEFAAGATAKLMFGAYAETLRSDGGFISRIDGADLDAYILTQYGGGTGFGLDLGVAGVLKDKKTSFSVGLLNLLDTMSWGNSTQQDSIFASARDLKATDFLDVKGSIENILNKENVPDDCDEEVPGDCDADFHKEVGEESFSRSLPAMLRIGVAHQLDERLTLAGNWDQAFSEGFGTSTTPRLSVGAEYRLVEWLPARFGLSVGGRGSSTSLGFSFGPFDLGSMQLTLMDLAFVTRGGFFPGVSKGSALGLEIFRLDLH